MTEEMIKEASQDWTEFFDVFLSYRHHDADRIGDLKKKIESHGFKVFRDLDFPRFGDPSDVTRDKIEGLRWTLSRATCLIFAYSRRTAEATAKQDSALAGQCISSSSEPPASEVPAKQDSTLGVWMPWELGFFDGSISARIGVYLLDHPNGEPKDFKPEEYFKGSEYLQIYQPLTDKNLKEFLDRTAVRERRIDNVASAFVWSEHLYEECLANPTNVALGIAEWYADHAARYWRECNVQPLADAFGWLKVILDSSRITWVRQLRLPLVDALISNVHSQQRTTSTMVATVASAATGAKGAETQPPRKEGRFTTLADQSSAPMSPLLPESSVGSVGAWLPVVSAVGTGNMGTSPPPLGVSLFPLWWISGTS